MDYPKTKEESFKWFEPKDPRDDDRLMRGDVRLVDLTVKVLIQWSDKIIKDMDEDGNVEYTSGWVMEVLPHQKFVYNNHKTIFLAQTKPKDDDN